MTPEVTSEGNGSSTVEATRKKKKARKQKKSSGSSGSAAESAASSSSPGNGNIGNGDSQQLLKLTDEGQEQQQYRGKQRIVWTDELHDMFVRAYNTLGKDAVPKKILALMNFDGLTRENVASHLQKYRLSLKREEQRIPDRGDYEQPPLHAQAPSSPTPPLRAPLLHPPADQAQAASSTLHPLPPQARFAALNMSQLQISHQLLQTPPVVDILLRSNSAGTNLLLHQPLVFPMVQPIQQQRFMTPLEPNNYNPMIPRNNVVVAQTLQIQASSQAVSMNGGMSVPEANLRFEAVEMHIEPMLIAAKAEGQGRAPNELRWPPNQKRDKDELPNQQQQLLLLAPGARLAAT